MNESRITQLRQERGWTQEKLANESAVGLRTIQRLEAGDDASLETLSLVAGALRVPVRELFATIDNDELGDQVQSLEDRANGQQARRRRTSSAWLWLFLGIGVVVSMAGFAAGGQLGAVLFLSYWGGGTLVFAALRRLLLDPWLDTRLPLSHGGAELREMRRRQRASTTQRS